MKPIKFWEQAGEHFNVLSNLFKKRIKSQHMATKKQGARITTTKNNNTGRE